MSSRPTRRKRRSTPRTILPRLRDFEARLRAGEIFPLPSDLRRFSTGATRDQADTKPDYGGFCSSLVLHRFGQYMLAHRHLVDGSTRHSDNWKLGIPRSEYTASLLRHVEDFWLHRDGFPERATEADVEAVCCAILFNVQGYLHETVKARWLAERAGALTPPARP